MKHYRIRVIAQGRLYIETIEAQDIQEAFKILIKKATEGLVKIKEDVGFYQSKRVQITYEEVEDGDSGTGADEVRPGAQVGQESFNIAT